MCLSHSRSQQRHLPLAPQIDHAIAIWDDGRREEAIDCLRDLADRFPDESEIHLWLAPMLVVEGDFDRALEHARLAVELEPQHPNVLFRAAHDVRWRDTALARSYLERCKAIVASDESVFFPFPEDVPHLEGLLALDEGRPDEGLAYLKRAFALQPDGVSIAGDLAEAYLALGDPDAAAQVVAQGLHHRPGDEWLLGIQRDHLDLL
jgi:tetratricopeptide (TPR) repeat protein